MVGQASGEVDDSRAGRGRGDAEGGTALRPQQALGGGVGGERLRSAEGTPGLGQKSGGCRGRGVAVGRRGGGGGGEREGRMEPGVCRCLCSMEYGQWDHGGSIGGRFGQSLLRFARSGHQVCQGRKEVPLHASSPVLSCALTRHSHATHFCLVILCVTHPLLSFFFFLSLSFSCSFFFRAPSFAFSFSGSLLLRRSCA